MMNLNSRQIKILEKRVSRIHSYSPTTADRCKDYIERGYSRLGSREFWFNALVWLKRIEVTMQMLREIYELTGIAHQYNIENFDHFPHHIAAKKIWPLVLSDFIKSRESELAESYLRLSFVSLEEEIDDSQWWIFLDGYIDRMINIEMNDVISVICRHCGEKWTENYIKKFTRPLVIGDIRSLNLSAKKDLVSRLEVFDANNPYDFERYCCGLLRKTGWSANVTRMGADQGVDIIAQRGSVKIAIQCKLYGGNVPNSAVQQAHAGKSFYGCHQAVVVSNAGYTPSALELAGSLGVILAHPNDLAAKLDVDFMG